MSNYTQAPLNKQRKDKYLMVIPVPKGLRDIASRNIESRSNDVIIPPTLSMSIYGSIAPDVSVPSVQTRYSGQTYNVSSHARDPYAPQMVNFTIDNRFNNYWVIYKWLNILNDHKLSEFDADNITNLEHRNQIAAQFYMTDISIFALDEYNKRVVEFKYTKAFPTKLGGINFNDRDATEVESILEFAYSQFFVSLVENVESL
jgi:hypothetical protein